MTPTPEPARDPRDVLRAHGLWSKKHLSQNFLIDPAVPDRIAAAGGAGPSDAVFEIGAGVGTLTRALAARARRVLALEYDRELVPIARAELSGEDAVEVREGDAREADYPALAEALGGPLVVYGNLPYHLSTDILTGLLAAPSAWRRACLLLQREFAERVAAPPGTRACGTLSALAALWTWPSIVLHVPREAFHPAPKVDSAVLVLERRAEPAEDVGDLRAFRAVVRALFAQRRKMARGALRSLTPDPLALLAAAGLDGARRGESFTLAELAALSRAWANRD